MYWPLFFLIVFKAVLFSTGGFGPLPSLHTDFITLGWAGEKEFTEALSIGQVTPGPNGLWVISLCYLVGGLPGVAFSSIALLVPPFLILLVQRCYTHIAGHPATQGLLDGVVLVIVSFNVIVLTEMFYGSNANALMTVIAAVSAVLAISRRVSANTILACAAAIGLIAG